AIIKSRAPRLGEALDVSIRAGVAVAGALGAAVGIQVGAVGVLHHSITNGLVIPSVQEALASGESNGLITAVVFFFGYLISYYRLPLYPLDAASLLPSSLSSQLTPALPLYH